MASCKAIGTAIPDKKINTEDAIKEKIQREKIPIGKPIIPSKNFTKNIQNNENLAMNQSILEKSLSIVLVKVTLIDENNKLIVREGNGVIVNQKELIITVSKSLINLSEINEKYQLESIEVSLFYSKSNENNLIYNAKIVIEDQFSTTFIKIDEKDPNKIKQFIDSTTETIFNSFITTNINQTLQVINIEKTVNEKQEYLNFTTVQITGKHSSERKKYTEWLTINTELPNSFFGSPAYNLKGEMIGIIDLIEYSENIPMTFITTFYLSDEDIENISSSDKNISTILNMQFKNAKDDLGNKKIISNPVFSISSIKENGVLNLYDYNFKFDKKIYELYYSYGTQGIKANDLIREEWYLNNVLQENLSSKYKWQNQNAFFTDVIKFPFPLGMPAGLWKTTIFLNDIKMAESKLYIETNLPKKEFSEFQIIKKSPDTYILSFDYSNIIYDGILSFIIYQDDQIYHQSKNFPFIKKGDGNLKILYHNNDVDNDLDNIEVDFFINYDFIGNTKSGEKNE
ncbi:MAG: hypothetical protein P8J51_01090 [Dehalococcoidia bacterium]|nr:hypothetical protein [Dehalococcoidia bacterium]